MRRTPGTNTIALLVLAVCSSALAQGQQWLQYRWAREARKMMNWEMGSSHVELNELAEAGPTMPKFQDEKRFFGQWATPMAKSGHVQMALDRSNEHGKHDLIYVDSDVDGDLSDEKPVEAYNIDRHGADFGPIRVVFETDDGPITYHVNVDYRSWDEKRHRLRVYSGCWYEGQVTVGGENRQCVLIDRNSNGTFNDKSISFGQSDRIRIGELRDGKSNFVGNYVEIDEKFYRPEIARDGACVKLTEANDVVCGSVKVAANITEFAAGGENGLFYVGLDSGMGKLPVGKYRIHHWQIERKDEKGIKWQLRGEHFQDNTLFEIAEDDTAELDIGEPVLCSLEDRRTGHLGKEHRFEQGLKGRLGERIELKKDGRSRAKPPVLAIKSKDGKYDRSFSFEYG